MTKIAARHAEKPNVPQYAFFGHAIVNEQNFGPPVWTANRTRVHLIWSRNATNCQDELQESVQNWPGVSGIR